jgi:hypothetical protein
MVASITGNRRLIFAQQSSNYKAFMELEGQYKCPQELEESASSESVEFSPYAHNLCH